MHYQPSEIVNVLIAVFLTPAIWAGLRDLRLAGKPFFLAGYLTLMVAYIVTILEQAPPFPLFGLFNTVEHLSLGVAGIMFAAGMFAVWRETRRGGGLP